MNRPISPVRVRVPSGKTMTDVPRSRRSAVRSIIRLALRLDPRSTGISPCMRSTHPKIGMRCTSFFDTHLKLSGNTYISGMSSIDWWLVTTTHGRLRSIFSLPSTRIFHAGQSRKMVRAHRRDAR